MCDNFAINRDNLLTIMRLILIKYLNRLTALLNSHFSPPTPCLVILYNTARDGVFFRHLPNTFCKCLTEMCRCPSQMELMRMKVNPFR